MKAQFKIVELTQLSSENIDHLCNVLIDCVAGGASVSFLHPMTYEKAQNFWQHVAKGLSNKERKILVAIDDTQTIIGTIQLITQLPENQPHRADVSKLLVHSSARCMGVGAALVDAVDALALAHGRSLLVLDTVTGSTADKLYRRQGWQFSGEIPAYAMFPDGRYCPTSVFYKNLSAQ